MAILFFFYSPSPEACQEKMTHLQQFLHVGRRGGKTLRQRNEMSCFPTLKQSQTQSTKKKRKKKKLFKYNKGAKVPN